MSKIVVIVGGGFAGTYCAQALEKRLAADWKIILYSEENFLTFTPLLAEVVGASISPLHVVRPVRQMLRRTSCRTTLVTGFDFAARSVLYQLPTGETARQEYEHLVLACGMIVNTNVIPGVAAHAFSLKTLGDALLLRNRIIKRLEEAEVETDVKRRRHLLSFAVIGGGFSGVEVAGELYDLLVDSRRFYPSVRKEELRVVLVHSQERILPELPESLGDYARKRMETRGIRFQMKARAQAVTDQGVRLADGTLIEAGTVVCTIGNTVAPLVAGSGLALERGRIKTDPDMRVPGAANVWALGDCAEVPNAKDGKPSPTLAQFALRQARSLAANLAAAAAGRPTRPFSFHMMGSFAAIGHHNAVGRVFGLKFAGFFAWFLWRAIYLSKMPTFARKVQVAFDWACDAFFPRDIVQLKARETKRIPRAHYEPGEYLYHTGDVADRFYVIEKGKVCLYLDGWEGPIWTLGPGDHFGDHAIFHGGRRFLSAMAAEPVDVLAIGHEAFLDLMNHMAPLRARLSDLAGRAQLRLKFKLMAGQLAWFLALRVRDAMSGPPPSLRPEARLTEAVTAVHAKGGAPHVVLDGDGRLVGLVTSGDLQRAILSLTPPDTEVREIMAREVRTVEDSKPLAEAMQVFLEHAIKQLIVVSAADARRPIGVLSPFDILLHFAKAREENARSGSAAAIEVRGSG